MVERISVGYRQLGSFLGESYYHKFLVYVDSFGSSYVTSGWAGANPQGDPISAVLNAELGSVGAEPYGDIFVRGGIDGFELYDASYPDHPDYKVYDTNGELIGGNSGVNFKWEVIKEGDSLYGDWLKIREEMTAISLEEHQYQALTQNSNSAVDNALRRSGLPEPTQDGRGEAWAPGSGNMLLSKTEAATREQQELKTIAGITVGLSVLSDALTLVRAIESGEPLPIMASGIKLAAFIDRLDLPRNAYLQGAAGVAGAITSIMSLDAALEEGDYLGATIATAQTVQYSASAYASFVGEGAAGYATANSIAWNVGQALPYLQIVNGIVNEDPYQTASGVLIAVGNNAGVAAPYFYAAAIVVSIIGMFDNDEPPRAWGAGQYAWEVITNTHTEYDEEGSAFEVIDSVVWTNNIATNADGQSGGNVRVESVLDNFLGGMQGLVDQVNAGAANDAKVGLIPNRMPRLEWHESAFGGNAGYAFADIDPLTGVQRNANIRYDDDGRAYNATPGTPEAYTPFSTAFIQSALIRGAIAPMWEVGTARIQTEAGDPNAGLSDVERAAKSGLAATVDANGKPNGHFRPVTMDMDGDGRISTRTQAESGISFDWDDSGFLKETGWVGANDGFLVLDRNINNTIDSGQELMSNGLVADAAKGMAGLAWMDANYDGRLDANDPVFAQLRVWRDANQNGREDGVVAVVDDLTRSKGDGTYEKKLAVVDHPELKKLSELGIVAIDYANNRFIKADGSYGYAASPELEAAPEGVRVGLAPNGIVIESSATGEVKLVVTKTEDKSALVPGADSVTTNQDLRVSIPTYLLLANDRFGGASYTVPGAGLSIVGVANAAAGQVTFDAQTQLIDFVANAGFVGSAGFEYIVQGPDGVQTNVPVEVVVQDVNDAPVVADYRNPQVPIYGWSQEVVSYIDTWGDTQTRWARIGESMNFPFVTIEYSTDSDGEWAGSVVRGEYDILLTEFQSDPTIVYHNYGTVNSISIHDQIIGYDDSHAGRVSVFDPDDAAGFKFEVVSEPLYGTVTLDAVTGEYSYLGKRGLPDDHPGYVQNGYGNSNDHFLGEPIQTDVFKIRVWDKNGDVNAGAKYSEIDISVPHYGSPPPANVEGGGGGGKKPIAIDLDSNGFQFTDVDDSNVFFDVNGDGRRLHTAWVAPGDGLLARDLNGDGLITNGDEISFQNAEGDAQTDLEGLQSLDSNGDGLLSAADAKWNEFGIWQDANSNGVSDTGEFRKLDDVGVYAIELSSDGQFRIINNQTVHGVGQVQMTDGSTRNFADVTLRFENEIRDTTGNTTPTSAFTPLGSPLLGSEDKDLLLGLARNDVLQGRGDDDVIMDDIGDDVAEGGDGNDQAFLGVGNDYADGGAGNDTLFMGAGNDLGLGGDGDDFVYGESGNDVLFAGNGNDFVAAGDGNDVVAGNVGNDQLMGESGRDVLFGNDGNDELLAGTGDDLLYGGEGADWLDGGAGVDEMHGEGGNDTYVIDNAGDHVIETVNEGTDTVRSAIDLTLGEHVEQLVLLGDAVSGTGNVQDNRLEGNALGNTLMGLAGNDWLDGKAGADLMMGGAGDDAYVVDNSGDVVHEFAGEGDDTVRAAVSYTLTDNVERLRLLGSANFTATGNALDNELIGNNGHNRLDGLAGNDLMQGGSGNDTYVVDAAGDHVVEAALSGFDVVESHLEHYALTANVEGGVIQRSLGATLEGNALNNSLVGNAGNDVLIGGAGADRLYGGTGDDTYHVDASEDLIVEEVNAGTDGVVSQVDYQLTANVENLTLVGVALQGKGNDLDNRIVGTSGGNTLDGLDGADVLQGAEGDDLYLVDNIGDQIIELADQGIDTIRSNVSYALPDAVERIELLGMANINATGNALDNTLSGNSGANVLDGATGADRLEGLAGDDTYIVDDVDDNVIETASDGMDQVLASISYTLTEQVENLRLTGEAVAGTGNNLGNCLNGNDTDNLLDGAGGADTLAGGLGNDIYVVDSADDVVVEADNAGVDEIRSSVTYTLSGQVEHLSLLGHAIIDGTGNALDNTLAGNDAANRLDGASGADVMAGGHGDDLYIVDNSGDVVCELTQDGQDTVQSSVSHALADNVEILVLTGSADLHGTGNALDNTVVGNNGNNILDGGVGRDTLLGGAGNDIYIVDDMMDALLEEADTGTDQALATVSYVLPEHVENLTLLGQDAIDGMGNLADNILVGNAADNALDGQQGADTLKGGDGNDRYRVDQAGDHVIELAGQGVDTILTTVSYTLPEAVERIELLGAVDINATGNNLDNELIGNSGNNRLDGGLGADLMAAQAGDDTYVVDNTGDILTEVLDAGVDVALASITYVLPSHVENLTLTGDSALNGTGNALDNRIEGNSDDNVLDGAAGNDTLAGGAGDDTYIVDSAVDQLVEVFGNGIDTALTTVSYVLPEHVENLTLLGDAAIDGTGNGEANILAGNDGYNVLSGLAGNDQLHGLAGNDTLIGGLGNDALDGGDGNDLYVYAQGDGLDVLTDSAGVDTVRFGAGLSLDTVALRLVEADGKTLAQVRILSAGGCEQMDQGFDVEVSQDANGQYISPIERFVLADGTALSMDDLLIKQQTYRARLFERQIVTGRHDDTIYAGPLSNSIRAGSGHDVVYAGVGGDKVFGEGGNDYLKGGIGNDQLDGGCGTDILAGDSGRDDLKDLGGNNLMLGGWHDDRIEAGAGNDFIAGGRHDDVISAGAGHNVIAFNRLDGRDILLPSVGASDTLALGGGIDLDDLSFRRSANDLVLEARALDRITLKDWYATGDNQNIATLQVIDNDWSFREGHTQHVDTYDFKALVAQFDTAMAVNPRRREWSLMEARLSSHLVHSDTAALGGALAGSYANDGNIRMTVSDAQNVLQNPMFGSEAQSLNAAQAPKSVISIC